MCVIETLTMWSTIVPVLWDHYCVLPKYFVYICYLYVNITTCRLFSMISNVNLCSEKYFKDFTHIAVALAELLGDIV